MLTLSNIHKEYASGELRVEALKGVSLSFRKNEFVAVLGPSGCGKTTLLNIIGGLDRYTQGDLIIKGRSTREYKDADWDSYRNHSVGFVFQSYNLIPHQTVLSNVELALTLGGVPAKERRRRAVQALERVGLGDQLNKKPNEMSGGQMQRVAIARALVNDPEILLADEPTGALDSETSVQIMDVLKEIASDRLVIMVTHNPELAAQYATRTIRLLDGRVTDDTMPFDGQDDMAQPPARTGATSMHFGTALHLSLNNLMTKVVTAFSGSVGNFAALENSDRLYQVYKEMDFLFFVLSGYLTGGLMMLFNPLIALLFGREYCFPMTTVAIIVTEFYISRMRQTNLLFREVMGLFWNDRYKAVAESIINLVVSLALVQRYGVVGIIGGTIISSLCTCVWVEPYIFLKYGVQDAWQKKLRVYFAEYLKRAMIVAAVSAAAMLWVKRFPVGNFGVFVLDGLLYTAVFAGVIVLLYRRSAEYAELKRRVREILKRRAG